jgi:hypothetical protein
MTSTIVLAASRSGISLLISWTSTHLELVTWRESLIYKHIWKGALILAASSNIFLKLPKLKSCICSQGTYRMSVTYNHFGLESFLLKWVSLQVVVHVSISHNTSRQKKLDFLCLTEFITGHTFLETLIPNLC